MLKNEFFSQVFLCPKDSYSNGAALIVCDTSQKPNYFGGDDESKHLSRLYFDVYLGEVDDTQDPTEFIFTSDGNSSYEMKMALPALADTVPNAAEVILRYGRNWDGCQHVKFESDYEHICEGENWKMLCSALHALPEISQELLGPAWIDFVSGSRLAKDFRGGQ